MGKSLRKPFYTDQQHSGGVKKVKRKASRKVRDLSLEDTPKSGKAYKKEFSSYDINDWSFHCPKDKKAYRK